MHYEPKNRLGWVVNQVEEILIALILGLMTMITFVNVIARYVFNANILWALETTVFLFAWLVLLGASYCVKIHAHLGVDVVLNAVSPAARRTLGFLAVASCLAFSLLLLIGSWNYWAPFAALPMLDGTLNDQAWYEVNDIPMPGFLSFLEDSLNEGEPYEKMPRFIPYAALPIGLLLLTFRFAQLGWQMVRGETDRIIAAHEAEDLVEDAVKEE